MVGNQDKGGRSSGREKNQKVGERDEQRERRRKELRSG